MYCQKCGKQNGSDARFCQGCGSALQSGDTTQAAPRWETCEITWTRAKQGSKLLMLSSTVYFWADGIGPKGRYTVTKGEEFKVYVDDYGLGQPGYKQNKDVVAALDVLISKLARDGWEPSGHGEWWYSYRFRRLAR